VTVILKLPDVEITVTKTFDVVEFELFDNAPPRTIGYVYFFRATFRKRK